MPNDVPLVPPAAAMPTHIARGTPAFWRTSLALSSGGFATFALLYCVQPLMPVLSRSFGMNAASSSLVLSASTFALAFGLFFTGPLSDAISRRAFMVVSLLLAAIFSIAGSVMPTWEGLLVMRVLTGLSLSGMTAVAVTYLVEEFDSRHIGFAMGLYIGGNAIGGMSARLFAGVMVDFLSWRWALSCLGTMGLIAAVVFWRNLPASRHFHKRPVNVGNIVAGYKLHFKDTYIPWLYLQAFLLMGSFVAFYNYISYRLLEPPFSFSQAVIGLLSIVYISGIYSSAKTGAVADRLGRKRVFWIVITAMIVGLLLTLSTHLLVFFCGLLLFTFGFFGAHTVATSWVGRRATTARSQATSMYQICFYAGASLAGTLGGVFWHLGNWTGVVAFIVALLLCALAIAVHLKRKPD